MAFCNGCGNRVGEADRYCGKCGAPQPLAEQSRAMPPGGTTTGATATGRAGTTSPFTAAADPFGSVSPRTLSILCYVPVIGWVAAVIALAARRFRGEQALRFHAFQGLYIFAVWLLLDWVVVPMFNALPPHVFRVDHLLQAVLIGVWIFMLIKASHGETYSLPIVGELASRSAKERSGL